MSYTKSTQPPRKRSGCVNLVLIGTVVGLCGFGLYSCAADDDDEVADAEVNEVQNGHVYHNNHYVHGAGYYHAPFHAWFPNRWNDYDPARGYYAGGAWSSTPNASAVTSSVPDSSTVSRVNSQWRSANPSVVSSRKASIASSRSTSRGGFGSFFRSSSS
jgi:hypothetical protein